MFAWFWETKPKNKTGFVPDIPWNWIWEASSVIFISCNHTGTLWLPQISTYLLFVSVHREFRLSCIPIEHNYLVFTFLILRDSLRQQADAGSKVRWWWQQQSGLFSLTTSEDQDQLHTQAWDVGYLHLIASIPSAVPISTASWTSPTKTTEYQPRCIERGLLKEGRAHPASSSLPSCSVWFYSQERNLYR